MPLVYEQLRKIARMQMRKQSSNHTLSPTALVHEAFLRMQKSNQIEFNDRRHFFLAASQCMKWLLIDYSRAKKSEKRGGDSPIRVTFDERIHAVENQGVDIAVLTDALEQLSKQDARLGEVLELHFLAGQTIDEVAALLGLSISTVKRDLTVAKMWMRRFLDSAGKAKTNRRPHAITKRQSSA